MPANVCLALVWWALETMQDVRLAASLALAFHCMLRTGEMLAVTPANVSINADHCGVVALPFTKIGQRLGTQEAVSFNEPIVGLLLARACSQCPPQLPLLHSALEFRRSFAFGCQQIGVSNLNLKPYSLRRGGASHDFATLGNIQRTLHRGRWSSIATGRLYIKEGLALQTQMRLTKEGEAKVSKSVQALAAWRGDG